MKKFFTGAIQLIKKRPIISVIVGLIIIFGAYTAFGKGGAKFETMSVVPKDFLEQTSVSGSVVAAQNVSLGFSQNGRIQNVYATVGQKVYAGQVLAETENGDLAANVRAQEARLASLETGARQEQIAVTLSQIEADKTALDQSRQALESALTDAYTKSDDAIYNKADKLFSNPRINPKLLFYPSDPQLQIDLESERISLEIILTAWQKDISSLGDASDIQTTLELSEKNLNTITSFLTKAGSALGQVAGGQADQSTIANWVANILTARTNVDASLSSVISSAASFSSAQAKLIADQKNLTLEQAPASQEDIDAQQAQVDLAGAQLRKTLIIAPFSGTVSSVNAKVGQFSSSADNISLVSDGLFEVESFIPEVNISTLSIGNQATATLDAYGPDVAFSLRVVSIDLAQTTHNGISTYKTRLQFTSPDARIRQGMTANVVITTGSIPHAIVIPKGAVVEKNNEQFVEVKNGNKTELVPVTLGATSALGEVQVLTGLKAADLIVINPN